MNCADVRAAALEDGPLPLEIMDHISGCASCQAALVLVAGSQIGMAESISCNTCLEDLPAYIDQERASPSQASRLYPSVWWHLLICRGCAEVYGNTLDCLQGE